jgi:rubrerythrin
MSEKSKFSCMVCKEVFFSDVAGLPDSSTVSSGEPHECPVCGSTDTKKEE